MTEKLPYEIISRSVNPVTDIQTEPPSQSVMDFMDVWTKSSYSEPLVDDGKINLMIYITKSTKIGQRLGARHRGPAKLRLMKRRVYARQMNRTKRQILRGCYPVATELHVEQDPKHVTMTSSFSYDYSTQSKEPVKKPMNLDDYPKIKEAVIAIAHDNGCISRIETQEDVLERAQDVIDRAFPPSEVDTVEKHLASLSEEMFTAVTIGENPTAESEDPTEVLVNSLLDEVSASMFEG